MIDKKLVYYTEKSKKYEQIVLKHKIYTQNKSLWVIYNLKIL